MTPFARTVLLARMSIGGKVVAVENLTDSLESNN